ncbi:MAG: phage tail protein I [Delftia acidovorans]|nr:MAG: phage tail protein I [Delftia acidovorans]
MTDSVFQSLMPSNATTFERAEEQVSGERWDNLDIDVIRRARDPWSCPEHLLNFLAFERSVDLWNPNWPVQKKREVIAKAVRLHHLKGTERGLCEAIEIAGGELIKLVVPPAKTFLSPNTTPEQRAKFLSRYPQLRIYPQRSRGKAKGIFPGSKRGFVEKHYPLASEAFFRALPRAFIWDFGVETELTVLQRRYTTQTATTEERVDLRQRSKRRKNHYGIPGDDRIFTLTSTAPKRIFSVHTRTTLEVPGDDKLARRLVMPSLEPINVVADNVRERGVRKTAFAGRAFPGTKRFYGFLQSSRAKERVYRRTYLFDPSRSLQTKGAFTFVGAARLGMPPHNAEITVKLRYKRHRLTLDRFCRGFLIRRPKVELDLLKQAIRSHKRLSDRILLTTKTIAPVTAGNNRRAGTFHAGQIVEL